MEVGEEGGLYTYRYTGTTRMTPTFKMGSNESHFNVSVGGEGQSHKTVPTKHNLLKRKESRSGFEPRSVCLPA